MEMRKKTGIILEADAFSKQTGTFLPVVPKAAEYDTMSLWSNNQEEAVFGQKGGDP